MQTFDGGCHCGAVRFRVTVDDAQEMLDCNCSICRKKGIVHFIVPKEQFVLLQGDGAIETYSFNTGVAKHMFCRTCGIHPFYRPRSHPLAWDVNIRCLDDASVLARFPRRAFDGHNWEENVASLRGPSPLPGGSETLAADSPPVHAPRRPAKAEEISMSRPPLPPFDAAAARQKVRMAEDAWNTRDPQRVALAYTPDSRWRNRSEFFVGREAIVVFLTRKWERELDYRLIKEVWAYTDDRIGVRFQYECRVDGRWLRCHGNEMWEFDGEGLMRRREASINDVPISEAERKFRWPLGPRPADHPGLTDLGS